MVVCNNCHEKYNIYNQSDVTKHTHDLDDNQVDVKKQNEVEAKPKKVEDETSEFKNDYWSKFDKNNQVNNSDDFYEIPLDDPDGELSAAALEIQEIMKNKPIQESLQRNGPYSINNIPKSLTQEEYQKYSKMQPRPDWWATYYQQQRILKTRRYTQNAKKKEEKNKEETEIRLKINELMKRKNFLLKSKTQFLDTYFDPPPSYESSINDYDTKANAHKVANIISQAFDKPFVVPQKQLPKKELPKKQHPILGDFVPTVSSMKNFWKGIYFRKRQELVILLSHDTIEHLKHQEKIDKLPVLDDDQEQVAELEIMTMENLFPKTIIKIGLNETISDLKIRATKEMHIFLNQIRLFVYSGKSLEDNQLIKDFYIPGAPKIFLITNINSGTKTNDKLVA